MRELGYDQTAVDAIMKHTKLKLLEAAGGRERLAKKLTAHIPEFWGSDDSNAGNTGGEDE